MPYRTLAYEALALWRASNSLRQKTEPNTAAWDHAVAGEEVARDIYERAIAWARYVEAPEPPPFDVAVDGMVDRFDQPIAFARYLEAPEAPEPPLLDETVSGLEDRESRG